MFLMIGALVGANLCIRIVLSEARERRLQGRTSARGRTRLRFEDYVSIFWRGSLFLMVPVAIGLSLDIAFGTTLADIGEGMRDPG